MILFNPSTILDALTRFHLAFLLFFLLFFDKIRQQDDQILLREINSFCLQNGQRHTRTGRANQLSLMIKH